jgi:hypothetical protein
VELLSELNSTKLSIIDLVNDPIAIKVETIEELYQLGMDLNRRIHELDFRNFYNNADFFFNKLNGFCLSLYIKSGRDICNIVMYCKSQSEFEKEKYKIVEYKRIKWKTPLLNNSESVRGMSLKANRRSS